MIQSTSKGNDELHLKKVFAITIPILFFFLTCYHCNSIDDSFTITDSTFTNNSTSTIIRMDTVYLFETEGRHTTLFGGLRSCTLMVDNNVVSDTTEDSIYFKISHVRDTLLIVNDTLAGRAVLTSADINSWKTVLYHFMYPDMYFFGKLFSNFLDSAIYDSIVKTSETALIPTVSQQNIFLEAMNKIVRYPDLFHDYREDMWMEIQIEEEDNFNRELIYLIDRGIMLDTSGEIQSGVLSESETEALRWFNLRILIRFFDLSPEAGYPPLFKPHPVTNRFSLMSFQRGSTIDNLKNNQIQRILNTNASGLFQIAYSDLHGNFKNKLPIEIILPTPFKTNSSWQITPLLRPNIPLVPSGMIDSLVFPGQGCLRYDENMSTFESFFYTLNVYYLLNGTIINNGTQEHIFGSIKIAFRFKFLLAEFNSSKRGILTGYTSDINIQKNTATQKSLYKEKIRMKVVK